MILIATIAFFFGVLVGAGLAKIDSVGRHLRDEEQIKWLTRDLEAARAAARRETLRVVNGERRNRP